MLCRPVLCVGWLASLLAILGAGTPETAFAALPQLPIAYVDTTEVPPSGTTIRVAAGGDLQAALNSARLGDVIELEAGATWFGTFTLPNKTDGSGWIVVRTSAYAQLPPPGTRVGPEHAPLMAHIVAVPAYAAAIATTEGAHHYRFVGIEVTAQDELAPGVASGALIVLEGSSSGSNRQNSLAQVPHHLIFDRCYVHAGPGA